MDQVVNQINELRKFEFDKFLDQIQHAFGGGERKVVPDPRTVNWPLMDFETVLIACGGYIAFIILGKLYVQKDSTTNLMQSSEL